ncbi:MAG: hypothetical protein HY673_04795 [Chloroflexi bacterium]|nr:hypothetical protein [Chloroflexota bacterium]
MAKTGYSTTTADQEAIEHLAEAIRKGALWFVALLEAISLWQSPDETYKRKKYCYLIKGEAFDWLLLAQRLLDTVNGLVPEAEVSELLFTGDLPEGVTRADFRRIIGSKKYRAYLNYFYGVEVEQALELAVETEIRKERRASGWRSMSGIEDEVYERIYGAGKAELWGEFRKQKGGAAGDSLDLGEMKAFTYWLFGYRMAKSEKEVFASDTRKGLNLLHRLKAKR